MPSLRTSLFAAALCFVSVTRLIAAEPGRMTIHVDRPGVKISPMLYGIFFEEINRAGDGGIYAEMVQNRSFEDDRGPNNTKPTRIPAWSLLTAPGAEATMALDDSQPINGKNPHSLRLAIAKAGPQRSGVANEGFHGIAVTAGKEYLLSFYARCCEKFRGPLEVSLEDAQGKVFATAKLDGIGPQWKKLDCRLTATETTATARLVLATTSGGTVWLDMVSLFPKDTWKGRPNGLRADLAEMLAGMKPRFVRFPGGCYVEGNKLANASRWKDSIGDVAERPGHWNLWGYRSTDGLGYHEYLQMCEDLGAEPLFVINCGMAHEDHIPMDKMGPFVQDALDAIEYANGPADSRWGSLRAKAGHPAPFNMKYLEIGNENGGPVYEERYTLFYEALKAKYPDVALVANVPTRQRPTEILDEHYYNNPEFFINNANKYNSYDRKGPKIYVGEYAVTQGCGKGNLRAAVGEAAFMTGMERNSDIVTMCSYAPLFVNCGWRQWNPNAINFDVSRVYGTPSYHVQKMFAEALGDTVLAMDFESPVVSQSSKGGAIGVGTWATQAEFKDIKVTQSGKTLLESNFAEGLKGWKTYGGRWETKDGVLRQTAPGENVRAIAGDKSWKDYTLSLKARKLGGAEGFLVLFDVQNPEAKSWWNIGGWGNQRHAIEIGSQLDGGAAGGVETGRWYDIRVETQKGRIRCYLDGKLIHEVERGSRSIYAVASHSAKTGEVIVKVVNVCDEPQAVAIDLAGLRGKVRSATATTLASTSPMDENSLDVPTKVAPAATSLPAGDAFRHTFPAQSVTVMRIGVKE